MALIDHLYLFGWCGPCWTIPFQIILKLVINSIKGFIEIWMRNEKFIKSENDKRLVTGGLLKIWKYGPLSARNLNAEVLQAALPSGLSHAQPMWTICRDIEDDIYTKKQNIHTIAFCTVFINRPECTLSKGWSSRTTVRHLWRDTFKKVPPLYSGAAVSAAMQQFAFDLPQVDLGCFSAFL